MAGGGVKNPALMERIAAALAPVPIRRSDEIGVPSNAREAMAFAVLADMTLRGQAAHLPPVTGAAHPSCLASCRSRRSLALRFSQVVLLPKNPVDITGSVQDANDDDAVSQGLVVDHARREFRDG